MIGRAPLCGSAAVPSVVSKATFSPRKTNEPAARIDAVRLGRDVGRQLVELQDVAPSAILMRTALSRTAERIELQLLERRDEGRDAAQRGPLRRSVASFVVKSAVNVALSSVMRAPLPVISMARTSPLRARPVRLCGIDSVPLSSSITGASSRRTGELRL